MHPDFTCLEYKGRYVALICRAASTSIRRALVSQGATVAQPQGPVIAYIRDPFKRLLSAAMFLPGRYRGVEDNGYRAFVDLVLSGEQDRHWIPQADLLAGVEIEPVAFEFMNAHWHALEFPTLTHSNTTNEGRLKRHIDTRYRIDDIIEYYRADYELRDSLWPS